jgi:hypothetical protein
MKTLLIHPRSTDWRRLVVRDCEVFGIKEATP